MSPGPAGSAPPPPAVLVLQPPHASTIAQNPLPQLTPTALPASAASAATAAAAAAFAAAAHPPTVSDVIAAAEQPAHAGGASDEVDMFFGLTDIQSLVDIDDGEATFGSG
eukprot:96318-Prymnesium_polylepis.1